MAKYKVREGFVLHYTDEDGSKQVFQSGKTVNLEDHEYPDYAHMVEPAPAAEGKGAKGA